MFVVNNAPPTRPARLLGALRKRWYVILLAGAVGGVGVYLLSTLITPVYHASASLYFSLRAGDSATDINQGSTYTQNQMLSFAQLATSAAVLDKVEDDLDGSMTEIELRRVVSVTAPQETVILEVGADTTSADQSAKIANSVAENLATVVAQVAPVDTNGKSTVSARVIQPATPPQFQASPNKQQNAVLGAALGIALAVAALLIAAASDTRVRSVTALKTVTGRALLGVAEASRSKDDGRPVALRSPNGSATERFRQIRAALRFASASHEMKVIAVTSSIPGEGKSMTATNLALIVAESRERVLLIDADLRRPRVADYLSLEGTVGLTTVLVGGVTFEDARQAFGGTTLDVLTAGEVPPNPAELLASTHMRDLMAKVSSAYDMVIIDTAPLLSVADAAVIAQQTDSTVVVADASKVRKVQLEQTLEALDVAGVHVAGLILNRVKPSSRRDSYYREYHSEPASQEKPLWRRLRRGHAAASGDARSEPDA